MFIKGDDFQEKIKAENFKKFMNIISNDVVLKDLIGNNIDDINKNYIKNINNNKILIKEIRSFSFSSSSKNESKLFRFTEAINGTAKSSFISSIPECLKDYQNFYGCGQSPLNNVICLIAGICLFINSKKKT